MSMPPCRLREPLRLTGGPAALFVFLLALVIPGFALASPRPKAEAAGAKGAAPVSFSQIDLPHYAQPEAFREDLVINSKKTSMTMKRFVDHGKMRTEMKTDGQEFVMIEMGDEKGTIYTIMPEQKTAMKQSSKALAKSSEQKSEDPGSTPSADLKVVDLGEETVDGVAARKLRMIVGKEGDALGWFDKTTGAPLRMESLADGEKTTIEWKNRKTGPQDAELFAVPKGYEVMDMEEMMKKMGGMGGMGGMAGMGGGLGDMAKGYAGGMAQSMASNLGGSLGASLGGALGGPLGSIAGRFIGGKVGGMIGKKAVNAIN